MELDLGKLFIGGISWDTDEDRLKEYFGKFGEVRQAVIMRDRTTGRARGFGFIVFADHAVAEKVVMEKHVIDGRTVEAKKAVPRDDQYPINRNNISTHGSPGPGRTKKIFVGGLASTVTESDFKKYFDQFGTITDVVVMYDHNTQRPRGFGFITYDSEDAVDRVLYRTFHELNGKMVEVKRAVPKELSQASNRSPLIGYGYGLSRGNSFLNNYVQGYNLSSAGAYGVRMDGRFNAVASVRTGIPPFSSPGYGLALNLEPGLSPGVGGISNFGNNLGYGRALSPYYNSNGSRYNTPIGYNGGSADGNSFTSLSNRNMWGNSGLNSVSAANAGAYLGSGVGSFGVFGNSGANWGSTAAQAGGTTSGFNSGNIGYRSGENSYDFGAGGLGRNNGNGGAATSSFLDPSGGYEGSSNELYRAGLLYGDPTWNSASSKLDGSESFAYGLANAAEETVKGSEGYIGGYNIASRQQNRGIAA